MAKRNKPLESKPERASDYFGGLKQLPPVEFRGADCRDLAEQYRRVKALESIEPTLPDRLSNTAKGGLRIKRNA